MRLPLLLITALILLNSCKKNDCTNCIPVYGTVYDSVTKIGLPNVRVTVGSYNWVAGGNDKFLDSGFTDAKGNFNFSVSVDNAFKETPGEILNVYAFVPNDYVSLSSLNYNKTVPTRGWDREHKRPGHLEFPMLKKTSLTINMRRTQNDNFNKLSLRFGYGGSGNNPGYSVFNLSNVSPATSYTVVAAADIYTYFILGKTLPNPPLIFREDSIKCSSNGPNTITINY